MVKNNFILYHPLCLHTLLIIEGEKKCYQQSKFKRFYHIVILFLFVDRIVELEEGKRAVGLKNVSINEDFFQWTLPGLSCNAWCFNC